MTSIATTKTGATGTSSSVAEGWIGQRGMGLWGTKNPKWYPCVVKMDNKDGTIKVQWTDDNKFTKRLPVEKFKLDGDEEPSGEDIPMDIFAIGAGGGDDNGDY